MDNLNREADSCGNCGDATGAERSKGPVESRLDAETRQLQEQAKRSQRAAEIIARHPEFEELIELFGILNVPVIYGKRPF